MITETIIIELCCIVIFNYFWTSIFKTFRILYNDKRLTVIIYSCQMTEMSSLSSRHHPFFCWPINCSVGAALLSSSLLTVHMTRRRHKYQYTNTATDVMNTRIWHYSRSFSNFCYFLCDKSHLSEIIIFITMRYNTLIQYCRSVNLPNNRRQRDFDIGLHENSLWFESSVTKRLRLGSRGFHNNLPTT